MSLAHPRQILPQSNKWPPGFFWSSNFAFSSPPIVSNCARASFLVPGRFETPAPIALACRLTCTNIAPTLHRIWQRHYLHCSYLNLSILTFHWHVPPDPTDLKHRHQLHQLVGCILHQNCTGSDRGTICTIVTWIYLFAFDWHVPDSADLKHRHQLHQHQNLQECPGFLPASIVINWTSWLTGWPSWSGSIMHQVEHRKIWSSGKKSNSGNIPGKLLWISPNLRLFVPTVWYIHNNSTTIALHQICHRPSANCWKSLKLSPWLTISPKFHRQQ